MDSYNKKTIFHLPGLFRFINGYRVLFEEIQQNLDILKENVIIGSVYGSPACIWNGGRFIAVGADKGELENVKNIMLKYNIPARLTFTNCLLEEKHTYDTTGNLLLEIFDTGSNEILCNTAVLEKYIRNNYGNHYKYISSTTKRLNNQEEQLTEIDKDYYLVVLDYDYNKDIQFLQTIQEKDKCEILCNPVCKPNCPLRIKHYQEISKAQLENDCRTLFNCEDSYKWLWEVKKESSTFISVEEINNIYLSMGFCNFKLEGRTANKLDWVEIILYYLIKEEYKEELRAKLQIATW